MSKIDFEKEAIELLKQIHGESYQPTAAEIIVVQVRLEKCYNYGKGWKRDREFLSKEEHEKSYNPKRKKPAKTYKKKAI